VTCYRFGSVGEDTHICLWDMTEDMLKKAGADAEAAAAGNSSSHIGIGPGYSLVGSFVLVVPLLLGFVP
jgi:hypothetical protein